MSRVLSLHEAATLRPQQIVDLSCELVAARQQLDWFKRQLFGQKSERRLVADSSGQMSLGDMIDAGSAAAPAEPPGAGALVAVDDATARKHWTRK